MMINEGYVTFSVAGDFLVHNSSTWTLFDLNGADS